MPSAALAVAEAAGKQLDGAPESAVIDALIEIAAIDLTVARGWSNHTWTP